MPEISGAKLSALTGMAWRTIQKKLDARGIKPIRRERNADLFDSLIALPAVYAVNGHDPESLDLSTERARLAKWQADKTHQDVEARAGDLLWRDDVFAWVAGMIETVKARLVQIPDTVGQIVNADIAELVVSEVKRLIYEALAELAAHREDGPRSAVAALGSAAHVNGKSVGGSVSKVVKRKQRRARTVAN